jgi:dCMP deaminase
MKKWDRRFLEMAELVAGWSKDPSTQTGAVLVAPDKHVISVGFNGFPAGMPDDPPIYANREEKYSRIIHCEMNALLHAKESVKGATLYTFPFLSCDRCAVHMLQAGITRFVAPKLDTEAGKRWEPTFVKTRKYCLECGVETNELDYFNRDQT